MVDPGAGVTLKTVPSASSEGAASVLEITRPAAAKAVRASIRDIPTSPSGTTASPGPLEIVKVTADPFLTCVVARGIWLATRSSGIRGSCAR